MKTLLALLLLFAAQVHGQILIYKTTVSHTTTGNGFSRKWSVPGYLVVDAASGAAAEFDLDLKAKTFLNRNRTFTARTIQASAGKSHSVYAESRSSDTPGQPYTLFLIAKGVNVLFDVGLDGNRSIPRRMRSVGHDVYNFGIVAFVTESAGSLSLDVAATKSANIDSQTVEDIVTSMRSNLFERGFTDAHP